MAAESLMAAGFSSIQGDVMDSTSLRILAAVIFVIGFIIGRLTGGHLIPILCDIVAIILFIVAYQRTKQPPNE